MLQTSCREENGTLDDADPRARATSEGQGHESLRRDLQRAVRQVCPKSLSEDAEDLVQESLIRLLRAQKLGSGNTLSATYLRKVAYSAIVDEIRRRRRRIAADPAADHVDVEAAADETRATAPETMLGNAIEVCLQRLQPDRRRAVTLHLLGHSGSEIASILECNPKRAENLTHRGLAQLREYLNDMGLSP